MFHFLCSIRCGQGLIHIRCHLWFHFVKNFNIWFCHLRCEKVLEVGVSQASHRLIILPPIPVLVHKSVNEVSFLSCSGKVIEKIGMTITIPKPIFPTPPNPIDLHFSIVSPISMSNCICWSADSSVKGPTRKDSNSPFKDLSRCWGDFNTALSQACRVAWTAVVRSARDAEPASPLPGFCNLS